MPLGTTLLGSGLTVSMATTTLSMGVYTPGTYNPVSDLNRIDDNATRGSTAQPVFGRAAAYSVPGARDHTITLGGFWSQGDSGQDAVRAAEASQAVMSLQVLRDGTNGYTVLGRVSAVRQSATPEGFIEFSFDFAPIAAPVAVP